MWLDITELLQARVFTDVTPISIVLCNCIPARMLDEVTRPDLYYLRQTEYPYVS